jgi:hypothetical protein
LLGLVALTGLAAVPQSGARKKTRTKVFAPVYCQKTDGGSDGP